MNPNILKLITQYKEDQGPEALMALWESFQPLVIRSMQRFYITIPQREDIRQEAFLQLLECANKYDLSQNVPFESYYKMNLQYWFLNQIRKKTELLVIDQNWQDGFSMTDVMVSTMGNAPEIIGLNETQMALKGALGTLTDKQRQAVVLFYLKGIKLAEIAKHMGCSYKVAYKHKEAGITKIRKQIFPAPDPGTISSS